MEDACYAEVACYTGPMLIVPYEAAKVETSAGNSRFITMLDGADSPESARRFIASVKRDYPDASHHVPAFVLGGGKSVTEFCSDDGEPSGTAGRPLLAVLKGSGLGNTVIVVTRYFGGTLLGTGGLLKAYSDAGRAVLAVTKRAQLVETLRISFVSSYPLFDRVRILAQEHGVSTIGEDFAENISLVMDVATSDYEALCSSLAEISSGSIIPTIEKKILAARLITGDQ